MQNPSEQEATGAVERAKPATAAVQAHTGAARQTTGTSVEEDAASSVSEATTVAIGPRGDSGARTQAHARELEDEISRFRTEFSQLDRSECPQLHHASGVRDGELVLGHAGGRGHGAGRGTGAAGPADRSAQGDCWPEKAGDGGRAASGGGTSSKTWLWLPLGGPAAVPAGPGIHEVTGTATMGHPVSGVAGGVSYTAALGSGVTSGIRGPSRNGPLGPQGVATPGAALRQDHVAFLTQVGNTENPARDVARTLKSNIDPVAKGINDVTLRHTRYGVTVFSHIK
ncbi:hypothetical protein MRX96_000317 [Rhipicephalus microplus]